MTPVIYASPHSGSVLPSDPARSADIDAQAWRSAEDVGVDRLIADAPDQGVAVLAAVAGRAHVDLNRDPTELDPLVVEGATGAGPRIAAGYGVLPRLTGDGRVLMARRLTAEEAQARLAAWHGPYHAALADLMRDARARCGVAILIDWHSMPGRASGVDVVLGDRHGASADRAVVRTLRAALEAQGLSVGLNQPYAGGYATQAWGRPSEGCHAVQVELNRRLYLDETTGADGPGFARLRAAVRRVTAALTAEDWTRRLGRGA